ncbi:hypothetical protein EV174_006542 [Coemansia sp. RSA 2320]|nr:hypothetical protein EV174_006542 [Coemansia sp. RSA 2320]
MMLHLYEEKHVKDNDTILALAEPKDDVRVLAASIAQSAVEFLEQHLVVASSRPDSDSTLCAGMPQLGYSVTETRRSACQSLDAEQQDIDDSINRSMLLDLVDEIRMWTLAKPDAEYKKPQMYLSISAFIVYVVHWVSAKLCSTLADGTHQSQSCNKFRLILPTGETNYKPSDSDGETRIDIGLCCSDIANPEATVGQALLSRLMAAVGVECSNGDEDIQEAFVRLYEYTRQMYSKRYDLRFAWGVAICTTEIQGMN